MARTRFLSLELKGTEASLLALSLPHQKDARALNMSIPEDTGAE
jgi:hypothetical protein